MDFMQKNLFQDAWFDLQKGLTNFTTLLDLVYAEKLIDLQTLREIEQKKKDDTLKFLHKILSEEFRGFHLLLNYLRDNFPWLYEKYTKEETIKRKQEELVVKAINLGDIPCLPKYYVKRTGLIDIIKEQILRRPNEKTRISIFGMEGIGKTVAIASIMRQLCILEKFNFKIFWIEAHTDDFQSAMYTLYRKICLSDSSFSHLQQDKSECLKDMHIYMKQIFSTNDYRKSLIILNHCKSKAYVDAFAKVSCNLLTISQEQIFTDSFHFHLNFNREDSLRVFAKALGCDYQWLLTHRLQASTIYESCNGHPKFVMAVADKMSVRNENLVNGNDKYWNDFLNYIQEFVGNLKLNTHEIYNKVPPELKEKMTDLALFEADVNISSHMLETLWKLDNFSVEDIMLDLERWTIVKGVFDERRNCNIYGVPREHLRFLKNEMLKTKKLSRKLHQRLIQAYLDKYGGYHKFRDDNYIYQYIGHHLYEAQMNADFKIYFDLDFLNAKIRAAGNKDVLQDFQTYKRCITSDFTHNISLWDAFYDFLLKHGQSLHKYPYTSIIQMALKMPEDNLVHAEALKKIGQQELYFKWLSAQSNHVQSLTLKDELTAACFTRIKNNFLIGTKSGIIELWDQHYEKILDIFDGHASPITYLEVKENKFLSVCQNGIAKVWPFEENKSRRESLQLKVTSNRGDLPIPSPRTKQPAYQEFFGNDFQNEFHVKLFLPNDPITSAAFCNSYRDSYISTGSEKGELILWDTTECRPLKESDRVFTKDLRSRIDCVLFSMDDSLIFVSCGEYLFAYDKKGEFALKYSLNAPILSMHIVEKDDSISCQVLIVVGERYISQISVDYSMDRNSYVCDLERILSPDDCTSSIICSSFTEPYLIIGFDDNRIWMWDSENKTIIQTLHIPNGKFVCIDTVTNINDKTIQLLLTGFENKSVQLWHIIPKVSSLENVQISRAFFQTSEPIVASVVKTDGIFRIKVSQNFIVTSEKSVDERVTHLSARGEQIFYATDENKIFLFNINNDDETKELCKVAGDIFYFNVVGNLLIIHTSNSLIYCNEFQLLELNLLSRTGSPIGVFQLGTSAYLFVTNTCIFSTGLTLKDFYQSYDDCNLEYATLSNDQKKLCVAKSKEFFMFQVNGYLSVSKVKSCKFEEPVCSAAFSFDAKYLAFGCNSGNILIWEATELQFLKKLELHKGPVRCLKFAPDCPILVSLSEQVAWWNLKLIKPEDSSRRSFRSRSNSVRAAIPILNNLTIAEDLLKHSMLQWTLISGAASKPELLRAVKLSDDQAEALVHSDDFETFLALYKSGEVFVLRKYE